MIERALAARRIWLDHERSLANSEIVWDAAGRIVALRRARGRVRDLAVFPGLVDAHVHLQIEALPDRPAAPAPREFLPWVRAVMAQRAQSSAASLRASAARQLRELQRDGATAFGEIDSTGHSPAPLRRLAAAGRCYQELTGFHLGRADARQLVRTRWQNGDAVLAAGLSPHAPYSVSAELLHAAARKTRHLSIHCAELPEEQQFLRTGKGPFAELLHSLGRLPADFVPPRVGAVRWLEQLGVLRPSTQLVHCQELERGDLERIVAAGASVVVCPGTIAWFARTPPPVARWLAAGVPVAIGTDSRASNAAWSLRAELRQLATMCPELTDQQLLTMATQHGATALGRRHVGRLRRGGPADFVAVPANSEDARTILKAFVRSDLPTSLVMVRGRRIR